jgi:DNA integrity scanning protein DisA with diadenylate cyclase activity
MFETICAQIRRCDREILEPTIELAIEIAREGREGHRIGTLFTLGDADQVLAHSRPLILDPLAGHPAEVKHIANLNLRGTIKELAQLDGAFVISDEGVAISACRYLDEATSDIDIPFGLGGRHLAAAYISKVTRAVGIVVSESAMVRIFDGGQMISEIMPELWLLSRLNIHMRAPFSEEHVNNLTVLVKRP